MFLFHKLLKMIYLNFNKFFRKLLKSRICNDIEFVITGIIGNQIFINNNWIVNSINCNNFNLIDKI